MAKAKSSKNFYKDLHFVRIYFLLWIASAILSNRLAMTKYRDFTHPLTPSAREGEFLESCELFVDCHESLYDSRNDKYFWFLRFAQNDNVFWLDSAFFVLFSTRFCECAESSVDFTSAKRGSILEIKSWFCETSDEDRTHKSIEEAS